MPSRASRGDDGVGARTPARAPGTSADEALRATTSQERARAGLESIRRADAAVEAARETARARAAERASARAEAERYAAAADALAAETRARVADDFAPLVGELSRARFFRDEDGDPVAFSRIAGTADGASDAPATRPDADEDADARSVHARADETRARDAPRVVDGSVDGSAEAVAETVARKSLSGDAADSERENAGDDVSERLSSRRRWSPARFSVDALRPPFEEADDGDEGARSARRALSMPGRTSAASERDDENENENENVSPADEPKPLFAPLTSAKKSPRTSREGAKKPAVPRFASKSGSSDTQNQNYTTRESQSDPARRPIAFVGATATGAAMCARLLDAGFPVVLAPPTASGFKDAADARRAATLARHGATLARSPRHAVELTVLGTVEKEGACAGFLPRAWAPGVRARDRREAARRGQAPPEPTPVLALRPCAEEEDAEEVEEAGVGSARGTPPPGAKTRNARRNRKSSTFAQLEQTLLERLDAAARAALEDVFAPRSPRAAVRDRAFFGGALLVLNLNAATAAGAARNTRVLVSVLGVSFAQAATRGDPADAEDGKMRVAVAAADCFVVAREKKSASASNASRRDGDGRRRRS